MSKVSATRPSRWSRGRLRKRPVVRSAGARLMPPGYSGSGWEKAALLPSPMQIGAAGVFVDVQDVPKPDMQITTFSVLCGSLLYVKFGYILSVTAAVCALFNVLVAMKTPHSERRAATLLFVPAHLRGLRGSGAHRYHSRLRMFLQEHRLGSDRVRCGLLFTRVSCRRLPPLPRVRATAAWENLG
jgi:hypothetical protein